MKSPSLVAYRATLWARPGLFRQFQSEVHTTWLCPGPGGLPNEGHNTSGRYYAILMYTGPRSLPLPVHKNKTLFRPEGTPLDQRQMRRHQESRSAGLS